MFDSKASDWNIVDATPFGRDPMQELAAGLSQATAQACASTTRNPGLAPPWRRRATTGTTTGRQRHFDGYVEYLVVPQVRELLTNYGRIAGLIWFDTPKRMTVEQSRRDGLICPTPFSLTALSTAASERRSGDHAKPPSTLIPADRHRRRTGETPCNDERYVGASKAYDHNWKSPASSSSASCVDCASKGGNLLLNVGPTREGVVLAAARRAPARLSAGVAED